MATDTSLPIEQPLQQDISIDTQPDLAADNAFMPQIDDDPEKKKISQQSLNDFYATVEQFPDYSFEEAIVDFPEIKENEELFDIYSTYYVTRKAGEFNPEELNQKMIETYGYDIDKDAEFDFEVTGDGDVSTVGDGLTQKGYTPKSMEVKKEKYGQVPNIEPEFFPQKEKVNEQPATTVKDAISFKPTDGQIEPEKLSEFDALQRDIFDEARGRNDRYSNEEVKANQKAEYQYGKFTAGRKLAASDASKSIEQIEKESRAELAEGGREPEDSDVQMRVAERLSAANAYAQELLPVYTGKYGEAPKELMKIIDAYNEEEQKSGLSTYAGAYEKANKSLDSWMVSSEKEDGTPLSVTNPDGTITTYTNGDALKRRDDLTTQLIDLQSKIAPLNDKLLALDRTPGDGVINISQEQEAEYQQLISAITPMLNQEASMYKEYEFFKPVATAYSNRVSDLQSYVALYNDAKSKIDPELSDKARLAVAQMRVLKENWQRFLQSENLTQEEYDKKVNSYNQLAGRITKFRSKPSEELKRLDAELLQLTNSSDKAKKAIDVSKSKLELSKKAFAKEASKLGVGSLEQTMFMSGKGNPPESLKPIIAEIKNNYKAVKTFESQITSINNQIAINTEKSHKYGELQRYMNDPQWKAKQRQREIDNMHWSEKAARVLAEDIETSMISIAESYYALKSLAGSLEYDLFWGGDIPGMNEQANKSFRESYVSAYVGDGIDAIQQNQKFIELNSVKPYISESAGWQAFMTFSQAGASLATSMAGTLASGGNPYVGGAIAFSQVYGDAYYSAKEAGVDDDYLAHLYAGALATVAASGEKYALGNWIKSLEGTSKATLTQYIRNAIKEQGGKVTGSNILAVAKSVGINIGKGSLPETYEEVVEQVFEYGASGLSNLMGANFQTPDNIDGYLEGVLQSAVGGLAGSLLMSVPASFKTMIDPGLAATVNLMATSPDGKLIEERFYGQLDAMLASSSISQENYDKLIKRVEDIRSLYDSGVVPKSITNKDAFIKATALMQEKQELNEVINRSGTALASAEAERVAEIDRMLEYIGKNNKPPKEKLFIENIKSPDEYVQMAIDRYYAVNVEPINKVGSKLTEGPMEEPDASNPLKDVGSMVSAINSYDNPSDVVEALEYYSFHNFPKGPTDEEKQGTIKNIAQKYFEYKSIPEDKRERYHDLLISSVEDFFKNNPSPSQEEAPFVLELPEQATPQAEPAPQAEVAPQAEITPQQAAPKAPRERKGRQKVRKLKGKRVFPKRPKPTPQTPETPNGVPVTATEEQQKTFADTPISSIADREGSYVNYQGVEGTLVVTADGLPAVKTSDGSNYVIEGALPDRSMADVGIELVRDFDTQEAMTPDEVQAINETDETDATAVVADFDNNKVNVYGNDYEYVSTNVDAEEDVTSVTLKDVATGKEITVRNENLVFAIEEAKIRFEQREGAPEITADDVKQAAESIGLQPITIDETTTTQQAAEEAPAIAGGKRTRKVQPKRQGKAPVAAAGGQAVNAPEYAQRLDAAKKKGQELVNAPEVGVQAGLVDGMAAAIATSLNSPEQAKKFAAIKVQQMQPGKPKNPSTQMFEAATGIEITNDVEANNAAIDKFFETQTKPEVKPASVKTPKYKKQREVAARRGDLVYHTVVDDVYESTPDEYNAALKEISETGAISNAAIGKKIPKSQAPSQDIVEYAPNLMRLSKEDAQYELEQRAKPTKTTPNAVQEQTAGQVPVQPEATVGQEVAQGKPQPETQVAATEAKVTKTKAPKKVAAPPTTAQDVPTPEETKEVVGYKVANIRDLYNVNRTLFKKSRLQSLASAIVMDRLIKNRAAAAGMTTEQMYAKLEFRKAQNQAVAKSDLLLQMDEVFHSSAHYFKKFLNEKVGTGEGFQFFGYGMYFSTTDFARAGYMTASGESHSNISFTDPFTGQVHDKIPISLLANAKNIEQRIYTHVVNAYQNETLRIIDGQVYLVNSRDDVFNLSTMSENMDGLVDFLNKDKEFFHKSFLRNPDAKLNMGTSKIGFPLPDDSFTFRDLYRVLPQVALDYHESIPYDDTVEMLIDAFPFNDVHPLYTVLAPILDEYKSYFSSEMDTAIENGIDVTERLTPEALVESQERMFDYIRGTLNDDDVNDFNNALSEYGVSVDTSSYSYILSLFNGYKGTAEDFNDFYGFKNAESPLNKTTEKPTPEQLEKIIADIKKANYGKLPIKPPSDKDGALSPKTRELIVKELEAKYKYKLSADLADPKLMELHKTLKLDEIQNIISNLKKNGYDKVPSGKENSLAYKTRALIAKSIAAYGSNDFMAGMDFHQIMKKDLRQYLVDFDNALSEYGLNLYVMPPTTTNPNYSIHVIDKSLMSSSDLNYLNGKYSLDKMFGDSIPFGMPNTQYDISKGYQNAEGGTMDRFFDIIEGASAKTVYLINSDAYGFDNQFKEDLHGSIVALVNTRLKGMPNMITRMIFGQTTDLNFREEVESTDTLATGFDILHSIESMFAATSAEGFGDMLSENYEAETVYYKHPLSARISYQKPATQFFKECGYVGNKHPDQWVSRGMAALKDAEDWAIDSFNICVFEEKDVNIDRILKFQQDEAYSTTPEKFAADAQMVLHVMEASPEQDPVAVLVGAFETYLDESERATVVKAAKTGSWTNDTSIFFRKHFLDYLSAGKTPFKELQKVFDKFKQFLFDAIDSVAKNKKSPVRVSKEMRALYDSMLAPVAGKVSVPKALNPDVADAPMPNHAKGDKYMGLGGVFYTVVDTDSNGNTTVIQDGNKQKYVWSKQKIAEDVANNKMAKVNLVNNKVNKTKQVSETSTAPSVSASETQNVEAKSNPKPKPAKRRTTARTTASQQKASKSGAPKVEARVNENVQALASAPSEIKKAKDRSGLKRIYESLFGLDKRKAEAASRVAEMILGTIAKRQGITLKEVYEIVSYQRTSGKDITANSNIQYNENGVYRGAMRWIADAEAIIYALDNPNVSTPMHEMAHLYEKYLTDAEVATISGWIKADPNSKEFSEAFARGFERYLYDGVAPSLKMKEIFENFKTWMKEIYAVVTDSAIKLELNDDMRNIYAAMLGEKPPVKKTRILVDNASVSISKSPTYVRDGIWNVYAGTNKVGELVYNRITQKWEGNNQFGDISTSGRTEAINEMVTRYNNKEVEKQEQAAPKAEPTVKPETPILGMPPIENGMRIIDENGQEYKVINVGKDNSVALRRTDSAFGKKTTIEQMRTQYANGKLKVVNKKAVSENQAKAISSDINDLAKALGRKQEVATSQIGPRGEEFTGVDADEMYDINEAKRIGPESTRMVQSLGKGRVIKVADSRAGKIQNLAEGVENFTPIVLESGNDYVVVEEIPESNSKALENFRNFLAQTKAEDWAKKSDKLRSVLESYGLGRILNKEYSLLYGDITAPTQWGERNGQIILLDAGSLVAGYQQKGEFDKAEAVLKGKSVVGNEVLVSDESFVPSVNRKQTLLQADFASTGASPWSNLMASNPKAHKAIVKMTKKLIKGNGNSANDIAMILSDTMELNFPDLGAMPKDIAFDYVVKAMSEMGIQPDFSGVVQQPDETELSAGSLDEKTVFDRIKNSPAAPPQLKAALTRVGRFYEIESQSLADDLANALIDEYGMNAAMAMVKGGIIKGATASYIYGNVIDRMSTSGAKFSSIANVINEFALYQRQLGRGISALSDIYVRSPQGLYYMVLNAMNQTNAQAVSNAMAPATGLSGALATATQAAAGQVANNMTRNASTGVGSISTAVSDLVRITQEERLKALKAEAKGLLDQLRGIGNQLPFRAPTPKVQALQGLNKLDIVVQLGTNFVKRGAVRFNIWSSRFKQSLSSIGISFDKEDLEFIWETDEVKTAVQDVLDSGLAPLDGPIKDYMKSMQIKLADIVRKRAAERNLEIENLANDIATSLSVDPAVAARLATAIKADIDAMSKKMQEKIVKNFHDKMKKKYGTNVDAEEVALESLMNLVNNNEADPLAIAEAIKFAFGGVAMSDAQSDEFIRLADNVFRTREGSKNRQIMQKKLLEFTNSLYPTSFWDKYWIFFYANQLAGITTQVVNTLGNFYNSASQSIVYAAQDIRNTARMGVSYSVKDIITSLSAQIGGGLDNASTVMNTGIAGTGNKYADLKAALKNKKTIEDDLGYKIESVKGLSPSQAITQSMLNIWNGFMMVNQEFLKRFPNRFMTAVDNAFFQNNFERSIRRQTINEEYNKGLRGKDLRKAVNDKLYGTDSQLETVANMVKSEMDDVGLSFFNQRALADYIILKQLKGDAKAMINILANQSTSSALPNAAQLTEMMQNPLQGPMITAAIMQSDPDIINNRALWSSEAKVAVREAVVSQNVTENISDRARKQSEYLTLKNTPEGMLGVVAATMSMGVNAVPPLRFLVPYVNVPFNIANMFLDWFPLTSAARAYGLNVSNMMPKSFLQRFGVEPTSKTEKAAVKFGLEYDPILHSEQKTRAMYSAVITASALMYFVGKALSDDEEEEGAAITGGLFGIPYDKLGKNQKPYTVKMFGEEFSYENTPLFLVLSSIGNTCDVIRELKASDETGKPIKIENALTHTGAIVQYTMMSMFEALPINGLQGITEIFYQRKGTSAMPTSQKALLQSSQGLIKSLLTPVPILGNNLVKQMEQFYDPRRYVNDVFDPEVFLARATGHVIINTLSDGAIVMRDYLGREVVQYPGSRNLKSLEITDKSEIDKYIYANNFNFIPVSKEGQIIMIEKDENGRDTVVKVALKDDVEMFNTAYTIGGEIMRGYLDEFMPTIRSVNDKMLEKALIHSANDYQKNYVLESMRKSAFESNVMGQQVQPISKNMDDVFRGWGANKTLADGSSYIDESSSVVEQLRLLKATTNPAQRKAVIADIRAALGVKTEQEKLKEEVKKAGEKYNQDVNIENLQFAE